MTRVSITGALYNLLLLCWRLALSVWYAFQFAVKHKIDVHASSCTYYFLVSLVPAVIVAGWGTAALADKLGVMNNLDLLENIRLYSQMQKMTSSMGITASSLKAAGIIGIVYVVWGAASLMKAIRHAFTVIFPAKKISKGVITMITAHVMVPLLMIIAIMISSLSAAMTHVFRWLLAERLNIVNQSTLASVLTPLLTTFAIAVAAYACFMLLSPERPKSKPAIIGSLLFAAYFIIIQQGLSIVMVKLIAAYARYGAIGSLLLLLLWAFLIFFGLFISAEYVHVINDFSMINRARYIYTHIKEKPSFLEKFLMLKVPFGNDSYLTRITKDEKRLYDGAAFMFCKAIDGLMTVCHGEQELRTLRGGETYNLVGAQLPSVEVTALSDSRALIVTEKEISALMSFYPQAWRYLSAKTVNPAYAGNIRGS